MREAPAGVAPGEVLVGAARAIEIFARGDVEDLAAHGQVDGLPPGAVVGQEGAGREGAEEDRGLRGGEGGGGGGGAGSLAQVDGEEEEGEEDDVERSEEGVDAGQAVRDAIARGLAGGRTRRLPLSAVVPWCSDRPASPWQRFVSTRGVLQWQ